ncbi:InlB B-repeat-containing protein [Candidatus Saccharibacteria bacterium]|nr:InlB B-repeat-containing protein [Candidatus Saccharibacteria bacterium]
MTLSFSFVALIAPATSAQSLEAEVTLKSYTLTGATNGEISTILGENASTNPDDYPVKSNTSEATALSLVLDLSLKHGATFTGNDTVDIALKSTKGSVSRVASGAVPVIGESGTTVGSYTVFPDGEPLIRFVFNENMAGRSGAQNIHINTGSTLHPIGNNDFRYTQIRLNNQPETSINFFVNPRTLNPLSIHNGYNLSTKSNNRAVYYYVDGTAHAIEKSLFESEGDSYSPEPSDTYIEITCQDAIAMNIHSIIASARIVYDLDDLTLSSSNYNYATITGEYTEIKPTSNESYSDFKSRVTATPRQYGYYNNGDSMTFIIYHGRVGIDTPQQSAEAWADKAAKYHINNGYADAEDYGRLVQAYLSAFGENSALGQNPYSTAYVACDYGTALEDRTFQSTAVITRNGVSSKPSTRTVTIESIDPSAIVTPPTFSVSAFVSDSDTKRLLENATLKLQLKQGTGNDITWQDYTPNDSNPLSRQTNSDGQVDFQNLGTGTYRLVQTAPASSVYSLSASADSCPNSATQCYDQDQEALISPEFTISNSDTEGVKLFLANKRIFTVTFTDDESTALKTETIPYGSSATPPVSPTKTGYTFKAWNKSYDSVTSNLTIAPTWETINYQITYNLNDAPANPDDSSSPDGPTSPATNSPDNPSVYTIESDTITLATPARPGYTFLGWTDADDPNSPPQKQLQIPKGTTGDKTFTANWQKDQSPAEKPVDNPTQNTEITEDSKNTTTIEHSQATTPKSLDSNPKTSDHSKSALKLPFIILGSSLAGLLAAIFLIRRKA